MVVQPWSLSGFMRRARLGTHRPTRPTMFDLIGSGENIVGREGWNVPVCDNCNWVRCQGGMSPSATIVTWSGVRFDCYYEQGRAEYVGMR